MSNEQPPPVKNRNTPSWSLVQEDLMRMGEYAVLSDTSNRDLQGYRKYGTQLQPGNGRDSIRDAYEEAMDLVVYLKNAIQELPPMTPPGVEHRQLNRLYHAAIGVMCGLKDYQDQVHSREQAVDWQKARDAFQEVKYRKPQEATVEAIPTVWADVPSGTLEAHTGHPGTFQDPSGVEVANIQPVVFIPEGLPAQIEENIQAWKRQMDEALERERADHRKWHGDQGAHR
jgi:hypothetical protein